MSNGRDIDQILEQAAGPERASHVDPAFVSRVDQLLNPAPGWTLRRAPAVDWLGLLPVLSIVLAGILVMPVLTGNSGQLSVLWNWLSEPPVLGISLDSLLAAGPAVLWPYVVGLIVMVLPFSLLDADV